MNRTVESSDPCYPDGEPGAYDDGDDCYAVLFGMDGYVLSREDTILKVRQGIEDARAGNVHSVDEVEALIRKQLGV